VIKVARKGAVWLYRLQNNIIAHISVWTVDRYHLQIVPAGQMIIPI
jgi:hypothetical protein